jgi:hypothetical protein
MGSNRWTDTFLDGLRREGDAHADEALRLIMEDHEIGAIRTLYGTLNSNDALPPSATFPVLAGFFESTGGLPSDVDLDKIHRGEEVFSRHAFEGGLALLTKSLPEGYQAPNLAGVLNISGDLRTRTYLRLLGTLQTVVNVSTCRGFEHGGRAMITAQKLRLLHAGIRHLARRYRPQFEATYGVPVNQEDMLGTIMGFSFLVIEGWRKLGVGLTRDQEEDYLYLWLVFARMMGIHPPGQHESRAYVPDDLDDAAAFYDAYRRRHYVEAARNPDGVALAAANLDMLRRLIPLRLRIFGLGLLPRICMRELMGAEACTRLDIGPVPAHRFLKWALLNLHMLFAPIERIGLKEHEQLGLIFFRGLIDRSYGGPVSFTVPTDVAQLRGMVDLRGIQAS